MVNRDLAHHLNSCLPVEQSPHTPIVVHEIFINPDIENLVQNYDTLKSLPDHTDRGIQAISR